MRTIEAFKVIATYKGQTGFWDGNSFQVDASRNSPRLFEDRKEAEKLVSDVNNGVCHPAAGDLALEIVPTTKEIFEYVITGTDCKGKRFKIHTRTPQHFNVYRGNIWELTDGKRKLVRSIYN